MIISKPRKCLIISSRDPSHSAGLGKDMMDALTEEGIEVDFLTRYKNKNNKRIIGLIKLPLAIKYDCIFFRAIRKICRCLHPPKSPYIINNGIEIKYIDEKNPIVPNKVILSAIHKKYDLVITLFWQDMINSTTLKAIYDNQKCPILIYSPDMSPMTGGCFYFGKCRNFTHGCGACPGLNSRDIHDQSSINYNTKRTNYLLSNIAFLGNTWMLNYFKASSLKDSCKQYKVGLVLDENQFLYKSAERNAIRKKHNIKDEFVILLRSASHIRKGNDDIFNSIKSLIKEYEGQRLIKIFTVGDSYFSKLATNQNINVINFGSVSKHKLIELYNAADVFVSASIDDAGPSMINQSLMCGTPVVSYNTGVAIDIIIDNQSGIKVEKGNIQQLSYAIKNILKMPLKDYLLLRENSRRIGYENSSKACFSQRIISIYNDMLSIDYNIE